VLLDVLVGKCLARSVVVPCLVQLCPVHQSSTGCRKSQVILCYLNLCGCACSHVFMFVTFMGALVPRCVFCVDS
jgi:hypothetical protein